MTLLIYLILSHQYRLPLVLDIMALMIWVIHICFHEERKVKTTTNGNQSED